MRATGAIAVALGVALDWSNAVLGWPIVGVVAFVAGVWALQGHCSGRAKGPLRMESGGLLCVA
jgi:hypothetical protein